jgi:hypothetical protein
MKPMYDKPNTVNRFLIVSCLFVVIVLTSCAVKPPKISPGPESLHSFVDSTLYFNDRKSSISMRATFGKDSSSKMTKGYLFQFRTITEKPIFLSSASIVAGGKRLFIEQGQQLLTAEKSTTVNLSLEESLFVSGFSKALLQFKQNNKSEIFIIELHQLDKFIPSKNI